MRHRLVQRLILKDRNIQTERQQEKQRQRERQRQRYRARQWQACIPLSQVFLHRYKKLPPYSNSENSTGINPSSLRITVLWGSCVHVMKLERLIRTGSQQSQAEGNQVARS